MPRRKYGVKKSMTAWDLFLAEYRATASERGDVSSEKYGNQKSAAEAWKGISDEDKAPYVARAQTLKAEFDEDVKKKREALATIARKANAAKKMQKEQQKEQQRLEASTNTQMEIDGAEATPASSSAPAGAAELQASSPVEAFPEQSARTNSISSAYRLPKYSMRELGPGELVWIKEDGKRHWPCTILRWLVDNESADVDSLPHDDDKISLEVQPFGTGYPVKIMPLERCQPFLTAFDRCMYKNASDELEDAAEQARLVAHRADVALDPCPGTRLTAEPWFDPHDEDEERIENLRAMGKRAYPVRGDILDFARKLSAFGGRGDPTIISLNLGGQHICAEGFKVLAKSLRFNTRLREIFLYNTDVTDEGMKHLVSGLKFNFTLASLNLGENTLTAAAVETLTKHLRDNPAVNQLYMDWGVTNSCVKKEINALLATRDTLWLAKTGMAPPDAYKGHHVGFRGANRASGQESPGDDERTPQWNQRRRSTVDSTNPRYLHLEVTNKKTGERKVYATLKEAFVGTFPDVRTGFWMARFLQFASKRGFSIQRVDDTTPSPKAGEKSGKKKVRRRIPGTPPPTGLGDCCGAYPDCIHKNHGASRGYNFIVTHMASGEKKFFASLRDAWKTTLPQFTSTDFGRFVQLAPQYGFAVQYLGNYGPGDIPQVDTVDGMDLCCGAHPDCVHVRNNGNSAGDAGYKMVITNVATGKRSRYGSLRDAVANIFTESKKVSLPAFMQKAANHGFVVEFWGSSSPSVVESEVGMETDSSTAQAHFASAAGLTEMHLTVTHTATNEKQEFSSLKDAVDTIFPTSEHYNLANFVGALASHGHTVDIEYGPSNTRANGGRGSIPSKHAAVVCCDAHPRCVHKGKMQLNDLTVTDLWTMVQMRFGSVADAARSCVPNVKNGAASKEYFKSVCIKHGLHVDANPPPNTDDSCCDVFPTCIHMRKGRVPVTVTHTASNTVKHFGALTDAIAITLPGTKLKTPYDEFEKLAADQGFTVSSLLSSTKFGDPVVPRPVKIETGFTITVTNNETKESKPFINLKDAVEDVLPEQKEKITFARFAGLAGERGYSVTLNTTRPQLVEKPATPASLKESTSSTSLKESTAMESTASSAAEMMIDPAPHPAPQPEANSNVPVASAERDNSTTTQSNPTNAPCVAPSASQSDSGATVASPSKALDKPKADNTRDMHIAAEAITQLPTLAKSALSAQAAPVLSAKPTVEDKSPKAVSTPVSSSAMETEDGAMKIGGRVTTSAKASQKTAESLSMAKPTQKSALTPQPKTVPHTKPVTQGNFGPQKVTEVRKFPAVAPMAASGYRGAYHSSTATDRAMGMSTGRPQASFPTQTFPTPNRSIRTYDAASSAPRDPTRHSEPVSRMHRDSYSNMTIGSADAIPKNLKKHPRTEEVVDNAGEGFVDNNPWGTKRRATDDDVRPRTEVLWTSIAL